MRYTRHDNGLTRVAMTFGTHPAAVLAPDGAPTRLSTLKRRFELLEASGIDRIAVLGFDESMRDMTPEEFVDRVPRRRPQRTVRRCWNRIPLRTRRVRHDRHAC